MNETEEVIEERNKQYMDAWRLTGKLMSDPEVAGPVNDMVINHSYAALPWITILCKLLRALASPGNPDHWLDISGYAMLVYKHLTKKEAENEVRSE